MTGFFETYWSTVQGYAHYLWNEIVHPGSENYFYLLIGLSLMVWAAEIIMPWRKGQKIFRKDFWLDTFYMFFNFFLFNLIAFVALSQMAESFFLSTLGVGRDDLVLFELSSWPLWAQLLVFFLVTDFIQWLVHISLHRVPWLWQFHKVHHSVEEMGYAAHLRYHWMENVFYKTALYLPVTIMGGFQFHHLFLVHSLALLIGHINHANLHWDYGPLRYILNNPVMHLWHHSYELPDDRPYGMNYGISLSLWDYLFGTSCIPRDDGEIKLGFPGVETFPDDFLGQSAIGFTKPKNTTNPSES